jgi:thymidylate synthase (FAD)
MKFIKPEGFDQWDFSLQSIFKRALSNGELDYNKLVELGMKPENARDVLPLALSSDIIMTANAREFRHIFSMRIIEGNPHPDIRALMKHLLKLLIERAEPIYGDLRNYV